jgi:hypothetical protein
MEFLYLNEDDILLLWRLFKKMDLMNEDVIWIDDLVDFMVRAY